MSVNGRNNWWTLSASAGVTTSFVSVYSSGFVGNLSASNDFRGPVCFRVA